MLMVKRCARHLNAKSSNLKILRAHNPREFLTTPTALTFASMNAETYLRKQGWQGSGHSLDSTGRGIKKPLLISHKQDQLGLGKKKAAHTTDDQWWMRAYDQSLQNIGTGQEVSARVMEGLGRRLTGTEYAQPNPHQGHQSRRPVRLLCQRRSHRRHY
jgi:hypothetical protein